MMISKILRNWMLTLGTLTLLATPAFAHSGGFVGGNHFEYTSASGNVFVHCPRTGGGVPSGPSSANFRCYGYIFQPAESAQFMGPRTTADEVELTAIREDGTSFTKTSGYDGARGVSSDSFNLWIETLFQRPLLKLGVNQVNWVLKSAGQTVMYGSFEAVVDQKPSLTCPNASMTLWDTDGCTNSYRACSEYYYQYGNQCR